MSAAGNRAAKSGKCRLCTFIVIPTQLFRFCLFAGFAAEAQRKVSVEEND